MNSGAEQFHFRRNGHSIDFDGFVLSGGLTNATHLERSVNDRIDAAYKAGFDEGRQAGLREVDEACRVLDDECCGEINLHHTDERGWEIDNSPRRTGFHDTPTQAILQAAKSLTDNNPEAGG